MVASRAVGTNRDSLRGYHVGKTLDNILEGSVGVDSREIGGDKDDAGDGDHGDGAQDGRVQLDAILHSTHIRLPNATARRMGRINDLVLIESGNVAGHLGKICSSRGVFCSGEERDCHVAGHHSWRKKGG